MKMDIYQGHPDTSDKEVVFLIDESTRHRRGGEEWIYAREIKFDGKDTIEYLPNRGSSGYRLVQDTVLLGTFDIRRTILWF